MKFWFDLRLAFRFVFFRQKGFYLVARVFTILTIGISVAALLVALSAFRGYVSTLSERYSDSSAHIIVSDQYREIIDPKSEIIKIIGKDGYDMKYFGYLELIASSAKGIRGVVFEVLEDDAFSNVIRINKYIKEGKAGCIYENKGNVIIGSVIASILKLKMGDSFKVLYASNDTKQKVKDLRVCAIVDFGLYDLDSRFSYISDKTGLDLFPDAVFTSSVKIRLNNGNELFSRYIKLREGLLPGVTVRTWKELNFSMFEAIKFDRLVISFILCILIAVSVFNIISTLILLTRELKTQIAILRVMGLNIIRLLRVFFFKAVFLGVSGYFLGLFLWGLALSLVYYWGIIVLPKDVYLVSKIPIKIGLYDISFVFFVVLFFVSAGSVFPLLILIRRLKKEGVANGIKGY